MRPQVAIQYKTISPKITYTEATLNRTQQVGGGGTITIEEIRERVGGWYQRGQEGKDSEGLEEEKERGK